MLEFGPPPPGRRPRRGGRVSIARGRPFPRRAARAGSGRAAYAALGAAVLWAAASSAGAQQPSGSATSGERLFSGQVRFANGGPPCGACHAVAGLPFPGGGAMGPDLTSASDKYGPDALDVVLTTLFFPTMNPVFAGRLLTPSERTDIEAFLATAPSRPAARRVPLPLLVAGGVLCAAALALIGWIGRRRLRGVRAALVARRSKAVPP